MQSTLYQGDLLYSPTKVGLLATSKAQWRRWPRRRISTWNQRGRSQLGSRRVKVLYIGESLLNHIGISPDSAFVYFALSGHWRCSGVRSVQGAWSLVFSGEAVGSLWQGLSGQALPEVLLIWLKRRRNAGSIIGLISCNEKRFGKEQVWRAAQPRRTY